MRQEIGEALSALADGEANELDLQRVLREVAEGEVLATWSRWHMAADARRGQVLCRPSPGDDFLVRVRAAIAAADGGAQSVLPEPRPVPVPAAQSIRQPRWWSQPLGGLAVAASVAVVAVMVGQQLRDLDGAAPMVASAPDTPSFNMPAFPLHGSNLVPVSGGRSVETLPPAARAYQELARERLRLHSPLHAEHAAMSGRQGLMPFLRADADTQVPHTEVSDGISDEIRP